MITRITSPYYSGQTAEIIFSPCSGGTINLGTHLLPYDYVSDNYEGSYSLYFSGFSIYCDFNIPCPCDLIVEFPTPTVTNTPTLTPTVTNTPTPTPTSTDPPPTPTPTSTDPPPTPSNTPTNTPTNTKTPTNTPTKTTTPTPTTSFGFTPTNTPTPTITPSTGSIILCSPPCSLGLSTYVQNSIGQLICGNLTGSCGSITAYTIFWYDSLGNIALKSGFGTPYSFVGPYNYNHPMTVFNSPMLPPDTYTPILQAVTIAGTTYTSSGISGTTSAIMDCFTAQQVTIESFNCSNGTLTGNYEHRVQFTAGPGSAVPPSSMYAHFNMDPSKKYFPFMFRGNLIPDTLKMSFIGSNYGNVPIVVEFIEVGGVIGPTGPFSFSNGIDYRVVATPKLYKFGNLTDSQNYFPKVLNLSNFVINSGDYLIIEVIPNSTQNQTSWDLYFTCLETFNCESCIHQYYTYPYGQEIILSSITPVFSLDCNRLYVNFSVTGCSGSTLLAEDIFKYFHPDFSGLSNPFLRTLNTPGAGGNACGCGGAQSNYFGLTNNTGLSFGNQNFPLSPNGSAGCFIYSNGTTTLCTTNPPNTVIVTKINNVITITCSNQTDRDAFYNSYLSSLTSILWTPTPPLSTSINYYKVIIFDHYEPVSVASNCADNQFILKSWNFHPSSVVTTTNSPNDYKMIITMNLITNNYGSGNTLCGGSCSATTNTFINTEITPSYNIDPNYSSTSNTALRSIDPFIRNRGVGQSNGVGFMKTMGTTRMYIPWYSNITYPYSGTPLTIIPSLSATTCDWGGNDGFFKQNPWESQPNTLCESSRWSPRVYIGPPFDPSNPNLVQNPLGFDDPTYTMYTVARTDVNDPRSFDIYAGNYINSPTNFISQIAVLIYRQVGANPPIIFDPNYFV